VTRSPAYELPPDKRRIHDRVVRLEWVTIAYLVSAIFFIYLTLGASQAMKTAWIEDMLSLTPPIAFLIASRVRMRKADERFPYGYHRSVSIAFLCASMALLVMGLFLLFDSAMKLMTFEHPSIGVVQPFGEPIWLGWLMIPALLWSAIPAVLLGRMKLPLARALHDKVLFADAVMNKADWLTATAALLGVLGIAIGLWWADAVAACIISLDITHDGFKNMRAVIADLMDSKPTSVDDSREDPLPARLKTEVLRLDWVEEAYVRLREEGHVFFGEIFVVPSNSANLLGKMQDATEKLYALDWRLHDLVITPVESLHGARHEVPSAES
jgi:cation diffusion facilitator family transporter